MIWTKLPSSKYKGKTSPQIVLSDPDWFFWAVETAVFKNKDWPEKEAKDVDRKARNIKIPPRHGKNSVAEYTMHPSTGKFCALEIASRNKPPHERSSPTQRKDVIDLSFPRNLANRDKLGCRLLLKNVKSYIFEGGGIRLTKKECEDFFDDDSNFVLTRK